MFPILRLGALQQNELSDCGGKAQGLDLLLKEGHKVPNSVCVPPAAFSALLQRQGRLEEAQAILSQRINAAPLMRALAYDCDFKPIAEAVLGELGHRQPLVVRSSGRFEDGKVFSAAGQFRSILSVEPYPTPLAEALRSVWLSAYSPLRLAQQQEVSLQDMAVVVQCQVQAVFAGVCFSSDPLGRPGVAIEAVPGLADGLVGGEEEGSFYLVSRGALQLERGEDILTRSLLLDLEELAQGLERYRGFPVDIEWAYDGVVLWVVQARPATHLAAERPPLELEMISIDDIGPVSERARGAVKDRISAFARKHYFIRKEQMRLGLDRLGQFLLCLPAGFKQLGPEALTTTLEPLAASTLEVLFEDGSRHVIARDQLWERLAQCDDTAGTTLLVGECFIGEISGYSAQLEDGSVIIEYLPGAAKGLMMDEPVGHLLLSPKGNVVKAESPLFSSRWELDPATHQMVRREHEPLSFPLPDSVTKEVDLITRCVASSLPGARVEWLYSKGRTIVWDLTVEKNDVGTHLSPGHVVGVAYRIDDLARVDELADERDVIVDDRFLRAYSSDEAVRLRAEAQRHGPGPILVAESPRPSLSIYLGTAAGFVFDHGSLLGHLAIILREAQVPAVVLPGATRRINTGDLLEIYDGQVRIHPAGSTG